MNPDPDVEVVKDYILTYVPGANLKTLPLAALSRISSRLEQPPIGTERIVEHLQAENARLRRIEEAARTFYHRFRAEADQRFEGQGLGPVEYALRTALEGSE